MSGRTFTIKAIWDPEAEVYYSESDIVGLHIEAPTLDAFEKVIFSAALDLVVANHLSKTDLATRPLAELIPAIVWERPTDSRAAA